MNERIKELMKGSFDVTVDSRGREECTADYAGIEKFAMLIVKECLDVINQPNGVGDDDVIRISKDIEEHFGVKP